jgi:predicted MFS family arabinose efflux permease
MKQPVGVDTLSPKSTAALAIAGTLAWLPMNLLPYEITTLADDFKLGMRGASLAATLQLLVLASTATWLGRTIDRRDKRRLTILGILIGIAASVISMLVHNVESLIVCCSVVGVGCGMIAAATCALPTLHENPERVFAYMQVTSGVQFGLGNWAIGVAAPLGNDRVFFVQMAFLVVLGGSALLLPSGVMKTGVGAAAVRNQRVSKEVLVGVAAITLLWASIEGIWAFAERAGIGRGLSEQSLVMWLTISGFTASGGGIVAAALGERYGYVAPLAAGFICHIFSAMTMYCLGGHDTYIVGIMVFNAPVSLTTAYLMGLLAELDRTGRGSAIGGAATNFGAAVGPVLGLLVTRIENLAPVGIATTSLLSIAFGLSVWAAKRQLSISAAHRLAGQGGVECAGAAPTGPF